MKSKILTLVFSMLSIAIFAQNIALSEKLIQQYQSKSAAAQLATATTQDRFWLTPILLEVRKNWNNLTPQARNKFSSFLMRPEFMGTEQTKADGNFLFHYTTDGPAGESVDATDANTNNVPDYVDYMIARFAEVSAKIHGSGGYTLPPNDAGAGGDNLYDVYISGDVAGSSIYGYVSPEDNIGDNPNSPVLVETNCTISYMVMRNNYVDFLATDPLKPVDVTASHEYLHAVQFGYNAEAGGWLFESNAAWSEDWVYPGNDDNLQYLDDIFGKPDVALNITPDQSEDYDGHWYSSWLFFKFITEHTNNDVPRKILERSITTPTSIDAVNDELKANWNTDFRETYTQFVIANGVLSKEAVHAPYIYNRANVYKTYIDAHTGLNFENGSTPFDLQTPSVTWNSQTDGNNTLMCLGADYFNMTADRNFKLTFTPELVSDESGLILVKQSDAAIVVQYANSAGEIEVNDQSTWSTFLPIVIRYNADETDTISLNYTLTIDAGVVGVKDQIASDFQVFPNPVADVLEVKSTKLADCEATLTDIKGQKVVNPQWSDANTKINVKDLENGTYFLNFFNKGRLVRSEKVVILH
jgi:hypothetical protein